MKFAPAAAIALVALSATALPARAQVFGQLTGAETLPVNGHLFGAYLHASEHIVGLLAQLRLSFYPAIDFGFQGGLTRIDVLGEDVTTLRVGGDVKFLAARAGEAFPVDFAIGGVLGVETGNDISVLTVGPSLVASRPLALGSGSAITPYAGLGLLFSSIDVPGSETAAFSFPLRLGAEFKVAQEFRIMGEFQLLIEDEFYDDVVFVTGINMPF